MELRFDNMAELREFLALVGATGDFMQQSGVTLVAPVMRAEIDIARNHATIVEQLSMLDMTGSAEPDTALETAMAAAPHTPRKRKRRTKAEMEAARAPENAHVVPQDAAIPTTAEVPPCLQPLPAAQPSENVQAILDAPTQQAAIAAGMAAVSGTDDAVQENASAATWIRIRADELGEVTALDHLAKCRGFIAKHGMPKYNETFGLAGLQPNVMAYTPHDCALHAATLDYCER